MHDVIVLPLQFLERLSSKYSYKMSHRSIILLLLIFTINIKHVLSKTSSNPICTIRTETPKETFNFTTLSNSDISISDDQTTETIRLRLCSPLQKKCKGLDGYSICLTKDGEEIGIGKSPLELKTENNTLISKFTGDFCEPGKNYTVLIIMKCDYSVTGESSPKLFPDQIDPCQIYMIWNTNLACITPSKTNCSIVDRYNNTYDLSPLRKTSDNYVVYLDKQGRSKMILNVCHSIIYETGAACPNAVGACLVNSSNINNIYSSWGELHDRSLLIENNILKMEYTRGDLCDVSHQQTTISFICDPKAVVNTKPEVSNDTEPCHYQFTWKTAAACKKPVLNQHRTRNTEANTECMIVEPETNIQLNFQTLMNQDFTVNSTSNTQYKFRICGPLFNSGCVEGTGICNSKNMTSAGTANNNLFWQHGGSYLNYTDGASCGNGQRRYTLIAFVCGAEGSASSPIILKDEPCSLIIHWYTDLACANRRISCAQNRVKLAPLIRTSENYVVKALGTEFHINICRPVVPTPGLACPHGSAVCQAVRNNKGQFTNETSLGFSDHNPVWDGDRNLILNYYDGSRCLENSERNISSTFKFICDYKGDVGHPAFNSFTNCHYIFEWRTNIVCDAVVGKWFSPCTIKDPFHPYELDLSLLYQNPIPRFVTTKGKNYSINICGGKEHCNRSAICRETNGYGTFSHVTFDYTSKLIKLQYSNGTKCSNKSYASELSLICNDTAGIGDPVLKLDTNCSALFEWQTAVACPGKALEKIVSSGPSITTEETSIHALKDYTAIQTWVVTVTLILVVLVIGIWLYLRNPRRCAHLRSRISAITAAKNHSRVQYSRVNTTEEARLLLDTSDPSADGHIDSDDELLGI